MAVAKAPPPAEAKALPFESPAETRQKGGLHRSLEANYLGVSLNGGWNPPQIIH